MFKIINIIIICIIISLILTGCNNKISTPYCHAVWEETGYDVGTGISAHEDYRMNCNELKTEKDCLDSIDIVNYKTESDSFNEGGDGLPDCIWK